MANNNPTSFTDKISEESAGLVEKVSAGTAQLKAKASEFGRLAADKIDENMTAAAAGLDKAAASIHNTADNPPGVETAREMAHATADKLSATAEYVREHDVDTIMTGVRATVRRNPGQSLIIAGFIGFLIGRSLRSRYSD
ncbi:MAG: hypothetical protein J0H49_23225 [Acidobacteria bacterium]|nr:hypothetical protein [Acidobacteriota bacterium]